MNYGHDAMKRNATPEICKINGCSDFYVFSLKIQCNHKRVECNEWNFNGINAKASTSTESRK